MGALLQQLGIELPIIQARPKRRTAKTWMHQCGSVEEALAARAAGADAVIAQGVEAGGHVRGTTAAMELLARVRAALPGNYPVLAAGGVADSTDVTARLEAGADAVVSGTRFLMSDESGAHPAYKERSREAGETILTELFGVGWPAQHRVIPNEATARWLRGDPRGPGWLRGLHAATAPFASRVPVAVQIRMRHRSGRAGRCSAPRPRPSGGRRVSRPGRSTPGSASTGSMTSAPPASSSASWPVSRFRARAGLSRRGRRRR